MPQSPQISDWCLGTSQISPYPSPELKTIRVRGTVQHHKRIKDGDNMTSSPIIAFDPARRVLRTKNTFFRLGPMSAGFKSWLRKNGYKIEDYGFNQADIPRRNEWQTVTK